MLDGTISAVFKIIVYKIFLICICSKVSGLHFEEVFQQCHNGSTSKLLCQSNDTGLIPYELWPGRCERKSKCITTDQNKLVCYGGIPVDFGAFVCNFNILGGYCHTDMMKNSGASLKSLQWKLLRNHICPHHNVVSEDNIVDKKFIVTSSGYADVELSVAGNNTENIYRFSMTSRKEGEKSRLELATCFVHQNRLLEAFKSPVLDPVIGTSLITYCPVANLGMNLLHVYKYELFLPRKQFQTTESYILTQWHGTANPNMLKDQQGCIAKISDSDRHKLCIKGSCKQGRIYSKQGNLLGLNYQHGGYPPLSFHVRDGFFFVTARSDERVFIPKGGCGSKNYDQLCPQHPRQQRHILLKVPFEKYKFDSWIQFEWKIVWSEYGAKKMTKSENQDPGILLSNAWIQLYISGEQVIDWVGPCGRNEEGRIPFFKIGMYNPRGGTFSTKYYMKRFVHEWKSVQDVTYQLEKEKLATLTVRKKSKKVFSNFNRLSSKGNKRVFTKMHGSCKLKTHAHHLVDIESIEINRLQVDDRTRHALKAIMDVLKEQSERILDLEERINRYDNSASIGDQKMKDL